MKFLTPLALLLLTAVPAWAGSFNVSPIRIALSPAKPTQALSLTNEGDAPVVIQVQPMLWTQQNWKDIHEPTDQVIATPPVVRIPAHGRQVVRVGLRRPLAAAKTDQVGMQVSLRLDLPLFVATTNDLRPDLRWSVARDETGLPQVVVTNSGSAHVQLTDIRFWQGDQIVATPQPANAYVLPGATRRWPLTNGSAQPTSLSYLRVQASADFGKINTPLSFIVVAREGHVPAPPLASD
jgi:fimbrial chaperone protein